MRSLARKVRDGASELHRDIQLRRAIKALTKCPDSDAAARQAIIDQLVRAWNNQAWAGTGPFLTTMLEWLPRTQGAILECGSGLSTLILSSVVDSSRTVLTLEHSSLWAEKLKRKLENTGGSHITLSVSPLKNYGEFDWYDVEPPDSIGYVICDGPPGETRGGRYGLGPVVGDRLSRGCVILLDDTFRADEQHVVNRWCAELGCIVLDVTETFTVLRVERTLV